MIKKIILVFMLLVMFIPINNIEAQEIEESIEEIGTVEEFEQFLDSESSTYSTMTFVRNIGRYKTDYGLRYISMLRIDGQLVYCIEPNVRAKMGEGYVEYDCLNDWVKDRLWKICYYGYGSYGKESDDYFVATQLMIWRTLDQWGEPYHLDGTTYYDVENKINEIEQAINDGEKKPSFAQQTIEVGFREEKEIIDSNNVLSRFSIYDGKNVKIISQDNKLKIKVEDYNYDSSFNFNQNNPGMNYSIVYAKENSQTVFMASRTKPTTSFSLNVKLITGDLQIVKQDEYGTIANGNHQFGIYEDNQCANLITTIKTDNSSVATLNNYLPKGKYYIKELQTSCPYIVNNNVYEVMINENELSKIIIKNDLMDSYIDIIKMDYEDHSILLNDTYFTIEDITDDGTSDLKYNRVLINDLFDLDYSIEDETIVKIENAYFVPLKEGETIITQNGNSYNFQVTKENDELVISYYNLNNKILFKGKTGSNYLRLVDELNHNSPLKNQSIKIFSDLALTELVKEVTSDEYGSIILDNLGLIEETYYYLDTNNKVKSFDYKNMKPGTITVDRLKVNRTYKVCEVMAKDGYEITPEACKVIELTGINQFRMNSNEVLNYNMKRRIDVSIYKRDFTSNQLLDLAGFEISEIDNDEAKLLGTFYTGMLQINDSNDSKYAIWQNDDQSDIFYEITDENNQILLPLDEGIYYYQKVNEHNEALDEVQMTKVIKGGIYLNDEIYGKTLKVCEVKAPSGYYLNNNCITKEITQVIGIDSLDINMYNQRIVIDPVDGISNIVPNMSVDNV